MARLSSERSNLLCHCSIDPSISSRTAFDSASSGNELGDDVQDTGSGEEASITDKKRHQTQCLDHFFANLCNGPIELERHIAMPSCEVHNHNNNVASMHFDVNHEYARRTLDEGKPRRLIV